MTDAELIRIIAEHGYSPEYDTLNHDSTRNWLYRIAKRLDGQSPPPPAPPKHSDK